MKMIRDYSGKIEEVIMVTDEQRVLLSGVENKEKTKCECVMSTWTCTQACFPIDVDSIFFYLMAASFVISWSPHTHTHALI